MTRRSRSLSANREYHLVSGRVNRAGSYTQAKFIWHTQEDNREICHYWWHVEDNEKGREEDWEEERIEKGFYEIER